MAIVSDLHLGGEEPAMISHTERLVRFLRGLPGRLQGDERLHLVIAGDFVDFLAVQPWRPFTADPAEAVAKLEATARDPRFAAIFAALAERVAAGTPVDFLVGNHDLELALPPVREALRQILGAGPERVRIHADGAALRIGALLVEHGNRYDGANRNDWTDLRAIASALSRWETPASLLEPSPGSRLVTQVINPIKRRYPFVDLLKPQGELTALLLFAFEPSLERHVERIAHLLRGARLRGDWPLAHRDPELAEAFGASYDTLRAPVHHGHVPVREWIELAVEPDRCGLGALLDRGERVPAHRLRAIRVALARLLLDDRSAAPDGPTGPQGRAAEQILAAAGGAVEVVVMGHTHLAREVGEPGRARYINTGTWADVVRVPQEAMEEDEALESFLRDLHRDRRAESPATWAEVVLSASGRVARATLESFR